jgi:hypothetical protein
MQKLHGLAVGVPNSMLNSSQLVESLIEFLNEVSLMQLEVERNHFVESSLPTIRPSVVNLLHESGVLRR